LVFAGIIALVFALFWQKLLIGSGNAMLEEYSSRLPNATQTPNITLTNPFNMKELVYLPVFPEGATIDKKAVGTFNYTLSEDFLIKGEPNLQSIEVWADKVSIKAIRVTFDNGNTTETTKIYGISNTTALSKLTKSKKSFPSTLQIAGSNSNYLKSNTPLT
jgi:hypothetical protein